MKVACVAGYLSPLGGGVSQAAVALVQALRMRQLCVDLIGLEDPTDTTMLKDIAHGAMARTVGPWSVGFAPGLVRLIKSSAPQLVHVHGLWAFPSLAGFVASTQLGAPRIVSPHGMLDQWTFANSSWRRKVAAALFEDANLNGTHCIHALNMSEATSIRRYGLRNPVAVIPSGVELPDLPPPQDEDEDRTVLFLSRIDYKKGVDKLLHAWAMIKNRRPCCRWRLQITGWGSKHYTDTILCLINSLGVSGSVTYTGPFFDEQKSRAFRSSTVFILPSYSEGLPMAVLEAWSYRLPVLMTNECNLHEGFEAGAAIAITTDVGAIADGLQRVFAMPHSERLAMGEAGRRLVEQHFTWDSVAGQMHGVYNWIVRGGVPPACVTLD